MSKQLYPEPKGYPKLAVLLLIFMLTTSCCVAVVNLIRMAT